MSERTTGATDEQIEAAEQRITAHYAGMTELDAMVERVAPYLVPPGMVIVPATAVPTEAELAALRLILRRARRNPTRESEAAEATIRAWLDQQGGAS